MQSSGFTLGLGLGVVVSDGAGVSVGSGLGSGDGVSPPVTVRVAVLLIFTDKTLLKSSKYAIQTSCIPSSSAVTFLISHFSMVDFASSLSELITLAKSALTISDISILSIMVVKSLLSIHK